ncbi:octanoyltransferase [Verticillium alfalfae VaMs.102]|uniref:Octanoyltransferase n=1 Tax=Verticillium alfalfae (strain VaMs.102 / ATCC MYA-4576 / FGSC 10136) TaxID=526221 RepID=C9S9Z0_VERA1|nr:octanoyltransferase [Verticillium alfalfae VaMs.102]EEY16203.1 octanoyltransferase [Verticillium alfalfae VaMs.102]
MARPPAAPWHLLRRAPASRAGRKWASSTRSLHHDGASASTSASSSPATITHIHLTSSKGFPSYAAASALQATLRDALLNHKSSSTSSFSAAAAPSPTVISFTPTPTYTLGRRQTTLDPAQRTRLQQPLTISTPSTRDGAPPSPPSSSSTTTTLYTPSVTASPRGGLTTYHGPGQLVLWPVLDLHAPHHANHTVRSYARLLEDTTRALLASLPRPVATTASTADPGVWIAPDDGPPRKIAALGVHLRRHVTALGVALNIDTPVTGPEAQNPWARFVPCGLEGKAVTSVRAELGAPRFRRCPVHVWRRRRRLPARSRRVVGAGAGRPSLAPAGTSRTLDAMRNEAPGLEAALD